MKGWQTKTLDQVCRFSNGLWKGEKPPFMNVGVIRNTNFTKDGTLDDSDIAYLDVEAKKLQTRRLQFGDIILEKSGGGPKQPVGRVVLFNKADGDFSFSNFTSALRVLDPQELDFRFLHKFLHWTYLSGITEKMQSHSTGIRNLDGNAYKAIEISFPSLLEQQRIVGILDEAFEGVATAKANAEKNLANARALFESELNSVFSARGEGWTEKHLGDLADFKNGLNYSSSSSGQAVPIVGVGDFQRNYVVPVADLENVTIDGVLHESYQLREGDIVTVRSNGSKDLVGRCMLVPEVHESISYSGFVIRIRPDKSAVYPRLLLHFLKASSTRRRLVGSGQGANISNINQGKLSALPLSLPPVDSQKRLADELDELRDETEHLEAIYRRKIAALNELKQSLLHEAFSGKL